MAPVLIVKPSGVAALNETHVNLILETCKLLNITNIRTQDYSISLQDEDGYSEASVYPRSLKR